MWGLVRKMCCVSSVRVRGFCSLAPLLLVPNRNLFSGNKNARLSESRYPYCLFSLADMNAGADRSNTEKKTKVLLPRAKRSPQEKHEFFPDDLRYIGSSHGWVACVNPRDLKLFLFNPLSPSDSKTLLPPISTLWLTSIYFDKLIMSAPPSDPNCRVLFLTNDGLGDRISFWKPGDTSWTPLPYQDDEQFKIHYSNHSRCFYVFNLTPEGGVLDTWDLSGPGSPLRRSMVQTGIVIGSPGAEFEYYLAESPSGSLFLVLKELFGGKLTDEFITSVRTDHPNDLKLRPEDLRYDFYVFKLPNGDYDYDIRQSFLGGDALFLGQNDSFWVSARDCDFPVEPNSIYFTESEYNSYSQFDAFDSARHGGCDMLIFHCDRSRYSDKATTRYYFRDSRKKSTDFTPIWVMPRPESSMTSLTERFVATCEYKPFKPRSG